jgi:hypothetical protein
MAIPSAESINLRETLPVQSSKIQFKLNGEAAHHRVLPEACPQAITTTAPGHLEATQSGVRLEADLPNPELREPKFYPL